MNYLLSNAEVFDKDFTFRKHDVFIKDGVFDSAPAGDAERIDLSGLKLIPGLTDIHFHGCMGHDFCEGSVETIGIIAGYEESRGVTNICPATMTFPEDKLLKIMEAVRAYKSDKGAKLVGINMEGPFISFEKKGAQNPDFIMAPDEGMFERLQKASGGMIKLLALAPETEGGFDFIERFKDKVVISFAHSAADYDCAMEAFDRGVHHLTHIFNAMSPMNHRKPGPVFAAVDKGNVEAEIICDGIHVHPSVVRSTLKLFGEDKVIFISDTMEAVGMPDGDYELGGQPVKKLGIKATLADGTIAGSAADLMDCLRTAVLSMEIRLETAVRCAADNPARSIGIYDRYGSIEDGKSADLVALDSDLNIKMVFNRGKRVL